MRLQTYRNWVVHTWFAHPVRQVHNDGRAPDESKHGTTRPPLPQHTFSETTINSRDLQAGRRFTVVSHTCTQEADYNQSEEAHKSPCFNSQNQSIVQVARFNILAYKKTPRCRQEPEPEPKAGESQGNQEHETQPDNHTPNLSHNRFRTDKLLQNTGHLAQNEPNR